MKRSLTIIALIFCRCVFIAIDNHVLETEARETERFEGKWLPRIYASAARLRTTWINDQRKGTIVALKHSRNEETATPIHSSRIRDGQHENDMIDLGLASNTDTFSAIVASKRCTRQHVHVLEFWLVTPNVRRRWTFYMQCAMLAYRRSNPVENEFPMNCRGSRAQGSLALRANNDVLRQKERRKERQSMDNARDW